MCILYGDRFIDFVGHYLVVVIRCGVLFVMCAHKKTRLVVGQPDSGLNWVGAWVPSVEGMSRGFFASLRRPAVLGGSRGRNHPSPAWTQFDLSWTIDWWIDRSWVSRFDSPPWVSHRFSGEVWITSSCLLRPCASRPGIFKGRVFCVFSSSSSWRAWKRDLTSWRVDR